ncbi:MAG: (2Fe-2S)-binding protein [Bdellovibrionaceae bacterium]|jgi:ferredoxin, 2Fe-2S|nr:(2Fe-2S)-binding protein [Pseudobdellovibrionaceae bacterium]
MITFKKNIEPISIDDKISLMHNLLNQEIPVASSCYGEGVCGMCRVRMESGMENLNPQTTAEIEFFKNRKDPENMRLSCQCFPTGPITIDTDYW